MAKRKKAEPQQAAERTDKHIVRITAEHYAALKRLADKAKRSPTKEAHLAIETWLANHGEWPKS
jgi:hypothetical protein